MRFEFVTATRIIFGTGSIDDVAPLAAEMGKRAFVVTGSTTKRAEPLLRKLNRQSVEVELFSVLAEPTIEVALDGVNRARKTKCDLVIGFGGGSVIDSGKVIAALQTNTGDLMDYLEVVGKGKNLTELSAPYIAIPTTAGTGSEVTKNAVLTSTEHRVKVSLRSPLMLPELALIDPGLTYSLPPDISATTGLDALTQLFEAFVSNRSNPLTDGICREGLERIARSLRIVCGDGTNTGAREDMSLASLLGGMALANAGLGAVHGMAGPLGGLFFAPHGVICARLLPIVFETNLNALKTRDRFNPLIKRFDEVAQILTDKRSAKAIDGVKWLQNLCESLQVPSLSRFGLEEKDFVIVVEKSKNSNSMMGNPIRLSDVELTEILRKAV